MSPSSEPRRPKVGGVLAAGDDPPRASLARILKDLAGILELLFGDGSSPQRIGGLVIHDPHDPLAADRHELILGIGYQKPNEIAALLDELGPYAPAGLIVRLPVALAPVVTAAVERNGVPLLGLTQGISWVHVAAVVNSALAQDDFAYGGNEKLGDVPSGDLFALANAITAVLDAPVTIEDRGARVLAFSGRQDEVDPSRVETILNREVSAARVAEFEQRGVFRELYRSDEPIFVEPPSAGLEGFTMPRMVLAVRASDEILGSIWAAVREPMSEEQCRTFKEIGPLVALHLMRARAGADVDRRLRADLVATVLGGGVGAAGAASQLGLSHRSAVVVALAQEVEVGDNPVLNNSRLVERRRVADALAMHLTVVAPGSVTATVNDITYGIVPVDGNSPRADRHVARLVGEFLKFARDVENVLAGVGSVARGALDLQASRDGAERAIRVLRTGRSDRRVGCIGDLGFEAVLTEFGDLLAARSQMFDQPLAQLLEYDTQHQANLVPTLRAWLDAFGDINAASQALFVHPNTLRYRLRRVAEVSGIDLGNPDSRLAAMLQLRLLPKAP
jgi:DNA-binding PucR family transcriptional regulator